jgi:hypothetical protein
MGDAAMPQAERRRVEFPVPCPEKTNASRKRQPFTDVAFLARGDASVSQTGTSGLARLKTMLAFFLSIFPAGIGFRGCGSTC